MGHAAGCSVSLSDSLILKVILIFNIQNVGYLIPLFPELWLLVANCLLNTLIPMAEKGNLVYWGELDSAFAFQHLLFLFSHQGVSDSL